MAEASKRFKLSGIKWAFALVLVLAGVFADYYYGSTALAIRSAIGIVLLIVVLLIVSRTTAGYKGWTFLKSARTELRKVVWPTRHETVQTTFMVIAMVVVTALILWGVDALFLWAVRWLTQGG